jgi:hypothetical protein
VKTDAVKQFSAAFLLPQWRLPALADLAEPAVASEHQKLLWKSTAHAL